MTGRETIVVFRLTDEDKAKARIKRADQVIVMWQKYNTATGVNVEINLAREVATPYLSPRRVFGCREQEAGAALDTEKMYKWTWDNLKTIIGGGR